MPIRSRQDAQAVLKTREDVIVQIVHEAFGEVYDQLGPIIIHLEGWTKAGVFRDVTKEKLRRFAEIDPGLKMVRRGNATSLHIEGAFASRVKKLDDKKRARISRTRASRDFDVNGGRQGSLDLQDKPLTNAYLGYVANENDPRRPSVYFVVNDAEGKHAWEPIELVAKPGAAGALIPATNPPDDGTPEPSRARIRMGAMPKEKKTG